MIRKLVVVLLTGVFCLLGVTSALAVTYNEAPMLRTMVAAGELPPVEERLPDEPSVIEPFEEIGQYGGTLHVFATDPSPWNDMADSMERGPYLLRYASDGKTVEGDLAKGFELSDDAKTLTIYLRKGVKWSDGAPFTADDILFMYEDMHFNEKVETWGSWLELVERVKKIDDYTVRFESDQPYPMIVQKITRQPGGSWASFQPKHYLKKWHIKYNPDADELAKEEGFDNWWDCMYSHYWWAPQKDLNKPALQPWVFKESTTTYKIFERNPYYHVVDTAGNQLPYIDKVVSTIVDPEVYQLRVIAGEADVAFMATKFENYSLYRENEEEGGYQIVLIPGRWGAEVTFSINQTHPDLIKRKINQDVRFRQALSLAINREEINDTCYFGLGVPRQATVVPSCSFYKEEWGKSFTQYAPEEARLLLDEMGLTERDIDGFRKRPDGETLLLMVEYQVGGEVEMPTTPLELVKEYWEAVGLKTMLKPEESLLYWARLQGPDPGIIVNFLPGSEMGAYLVDVDEGWSAGGYSGGWGNAWGKWLDAEYDVRMGKKTLEDFAGGKLPGEEPPEEIKKLEEWARLKRKTVMGSKEYIEVMQKIFDYHAKNLFTIGTVGMVPVPYIAKKNIGNVPWAYGPAQWSSLEFNHTGDQLFFKQ